MKATFTFWQYKKQKLPPLKRISIIITFIFCFAQVSGQEHVVLVFNDSTYNTYPTGTFTVKVRAHFLAASTANGAQVSILYDNTKLTAGVPTPSAGTLFPTVISGPTVTVNYTPGVDKIDFAAGDLSAPYPTTSFDFLDIPFTVNSPQGASLTTLTFTSETDPSFPTLVTNELGADVLATTRTATVNINATNCTLPTALISTPSGSTVANCSYSLILQSATGGTDYDLVINGTTYNNITAGSTITPFTVPETRVFGLPDPSPVPPSFNDDPPPNFGSELGVRFTASQDGFIKGIRFWTPNPVYLAGTYTGNLWNATTQANLATAPFTVVVANSWAEVFFSNAVPITAGTTYVASIFSSESSYTATVGYFAGADEIEGSITMPGAGTNGVFALNVASSTFPATTSPSSANYWVDVIYSPEETAFNLTSVTNEAGCRNIDAPLQAFAVTSGTCGTLPVTLTGLSATPTGKDIVLSWSTASELDNLGFEIQRKTDDGGDWKVIGFVDGAGNSSSLIKYSYTDYNLASRRYFYRLKQVDIDRKFTYSPIVSAIINGNENFSLDQNFPNPFRNETSLRFSLPRAAKVNLSLYDMNGKLIKVILNESRQSGTHVVNFNAAALRSGIYFYKIQAGEHTEVKKMTIQ